MCLDLPLPEGLDFDQRVEVQDDQFVITLRSRSSQATCPHCGQPSRSVQKCYWRRIVDLAIALKPVVLNVQARRFFCRNRSCSCHIFTEQINALARRYARCTERLRQFLRGSSFDEQRIRGLACFLFARRPGQCLNDAATHPIRPDAGTRTGAHSWH